MQVLDILGFPLCPWISQASIGTGTNVPSQAPDTNHPYIVAFGALLWTGCWLDLAEGGWVGGRDPLIEM